MDERWLGKLNKNLKSILYRVREISFTCRIFTQNKTAIVSELSSVCEGIFNFHPPEGCLGSIISLPYEVTLTFITGFVKIRGGSALSTTSGINVILPNFTLFIANYISRTLFQRQLSVNVELFGGFSVENPRDKVELSRVSPSCACHHVVWRMLSDTVTELLRCCEPLVTHHLRLIKLCHRAEKISSNFSSVLNLLSLDVVIVTLFKLDWLPSHIIPPKRSELQLIGV